MPQTLLLRLPAAGEEETEWLVLDDGGASGPTRQRGTLSLAAAVWRGGKLIALAPATQVLLAEPVLPPGSGAKLARAVPFALEEQLTEDVDQLVFAVGRRRSGGGTAVAVASRAVLQSWIDSLRGAGLDPQSIYPDISLIPENPGQTVLWLEKKRLAVRRPGALPFAVELSPVKEALIVAGVIPDPLAAVDPLDPKLPESAILYVTREDWLNVQDELEQLVEQFASLKVQLLADGPLPWLAQGLQSADPVNMLQGEFVPATDYGVRWRQWRGAALLAAALLLVHVAAQAMQLRQARHESSVLDGQMAQVFSNAVPGEPIRDVRHQMQTRLERIRKSGPGPQYFLRTLQSLSEALAATPKTSIDSMSYREQSLDMRISAPSLASLSQLSQLVGRQGFSAEIQSSNPVPGGVQAHVQLRSQSRARP